MSPLTTSGRQPDSRKYIIVALALGLILATGLLWGLHPTGVASGGSTDSGAGNDSCQEETSDSGDGEVVTEIADTGDDGAASVTAAFPPSDGTSVTVRQATLPEGGFISVFEYNQSNESYEPIGVSEYLEPGSHENVTIELFEAPFVDFNRSEIDPPTTLSVRLNRDTNGNERFDHFMTTSDDVYYYATEPVSSSGSVAAEDGADNDDSSEEASATNSEEHADCLSEPVATDDEVNSDSTTESSSDDELETETETESDSDSASSSDSDEEEKQTTTSTEDEAEDGDDEETTATTESETPSPQEEEDEDESATPTADEDSGGSDTSEETETAEPDSEQESTDATDEETPTSTTDTAVSTDRDTDTATKTGTAESPSGSAATITFLNQSVTEDDGPSVIIDSVYLPEGGYVTITAGRGSENLSQPIGVTEYLEPGSYENLAVPLTPGATEAGQSVFSLRTKQTVVAGVVRDADGNGEYDPSNGDRLYLDANLTQVYATAVIAPGTRQSVMNTTAVETTSEYSQQSTETKAANGGTVVIGERQVSTPTPEPRSEQQSGGGGPVGWFLNGLAVLGAIIVAMGLMIAVVVRRQA